MFQAGGELRIVTDFGVPIRFAADELRSLCHSMAPQLRSDPDRAFQMLMSVEPLYLSLLREQQKRHQPTDTGSGRRGRLPR